MSKRIRKLTPQLWLHRGVDIVLTHAPVRGLGDEEHITHRGFEVFRKILDKQKPRYWVYGHVHMNYGMRHQRVIQKGDTTLINAFERYIIDVEPDKRQLFFRRKKHD